MISQFFQTVDLGIKSLLVQKLRAGLAALGIFIGTSTVIWLVAMGEGVSYRAQQQILELGAKNIIVRTVQPNDSGDEDANSRVKTYGLLRSDYQRIVENIPNIRRTIPMRELKFELRLDDRSADAKLVGCSEDYLELNRLQIARGRWLSPRDRGKKVIVLADETAKRLFPFENPIGRAIWVGSEFYTVIGQTKDRTASAAIGGSLDSRDYNLDAYIPLQTLRQRVGDLVMKRVGGGLGFNFTGENVELSQITVEVNHIEEVDETAQIIETLLRKYHEKQDYAVVVPRELLRQAERTRTMFNVLLVVIAGISLLVGGIGIMNIMLATVTERTREIGVRRALGATRSDIIGQFLIETVVLTASGGIAGVLFGLSVGPVFRLIKRVIMTISPESLPPIVNSLEPRIAMWSVVLSLGISLGVGVLFGVYPARKAAYLDPIEALRHE
ncbi:ABC transporter permease [Novipirellula artificiosorum]|uniref:Macrolide export ATP-binding/permease protein MacB n=1 Tax=Novipirellula artificiosorum TaxID=2528016 RepID=A0A5C6CYD6_9BACT|nr:ABC transporter permease [Novipirellula artificiosorum]TWU28006.1 Macrolide export ATP-binding/permease protein MacB [Novipirellula artificiosorum]